MTLDDDKKTPLPNVLSIAGSDPSGGAGLQADLKTFAAMGCYGMAAVSALTAQNTQGVSAIHLPPAAFVAEQIRTIFADIDVAAVKVGMLGAPETVEAVASVLRTRAGLRIVVDPVLVATTGAALGDDAVIQALRRHLFPLATLVTPNGPEAARLSRKEPPTTRRGIETLAKELWTETPVAWLLKGGHGAGPTADDLLFDGEPHWLSSPRIDTTNTHGTGCTLSSAIAACLAKGADLRTAVAQAKAYVDHILRAPRRLAVGRGAGPLDHFAGSG